METIYNCDGYRFTTEEEWRESNAAKAFARLVEETGEVLGYDADWGSDFDAQFLDRDGDYLITLELQCDEWGEHYRVHVGPDKDGLGPDKSFEDADEAVAYAKLVAETAIEEGLV